MATMSPSQVMMVPRELVTSSVGNTRLPSKHLSITSIIFHECPLKYIEKTEQKGASQLGLTIDTITYLDSTSQVISTFIVSRNVCQSQLE